MSTSRKPFLGLLAALSALTLTLAVLVVALPSQAAPPNGSTTCTQYYRCGCCPGKANLQNWERECYRWYNGEVEESWTESYCSGTCTSGHGA